MLPMLVLTMMGCWIWISYQQGTGAFLCDTLYVQFGDGHVPELGYFSGKYQRQSSSSSSSLSWILGNHVEYIEERRTVVWNTSTRSTTGDDSTEDGLPRATLSYHTNYEQWVVS